MNHFRRLTGSAMALMTMAALSVGAFAADYSFETGGEQNIIPRPLTRIPMVPRIITAVQISWTIRYRSFPMAASAQRRSASWKR